MIINIEFHPYADFYELIDDADFDALATDIKENGLREKIWTYEGKILDGRNRYMACATAQVEPQFREFKGTALQALSFVESTNTHRRHLTTSQRAMAASRIKEERQRLNLDGKISTESVAKNNKVSRAAVFQADKVRTKGSKELQKAVDSGKVAVSRAAKVLDRPKNEQLKAAIEQPAKKQEKPIEVTPPPPVFDFEGYEPEDNDAYKQSIENVMMADDKLAAMRTELDQAHREIQALKYSRDHYQSQAGEAVRLLKARDREVEKLKKDLAKAKGEYVGLGAERLNS